MKRFWMCALVIVIACGIGGAALADQAFVRDAKAVARADFTLELALSKTDKTAVEKLLDADFTWTDSAGKTNTKAQVLQSFDAGKAPKLAISSESAQAVREYPYGQVAVVQVDSEIMHVLRVWVKRPAGWQALVYQEVKSLDAPPTFAPGPGKVCENPCKSVPYQPKNEAEKAVIAAYMGLESAAMAHSASDWTTYTAEEFKAASSNSDQLLDKPTRLAGLEHEKMAGVSPTPLVSARMFDFGDAIVMISLHQPDRGKPLHVTRVWIVRGGKWVSTLSYQTSIQDAAAVASK